MAEPVEEFQEIAHCGGQFFVDVQTAPDGQKQASFGVRHSRPTPASYFGIYVLPQGIPIGTYDFFGDPKPPSSDAFPVFIGADVRGMYGRQCPMCKGYWRSSASPERWPMTCAYCGFKSDTHVFLTRDQRRYVRACSDLLGEGLDSDKDGEFVIDMDQVADSVGKDVEKPKMYYSERSQQNNFECQSCGSRTDILGRYGYCCSCGMHNGLQELIREVDRIRKKIQSNKDYVTCVKDLVSEFDSYARQIAKQLVRRIPMTPSRKSEWERKLFHSLGSRAEELKAAFDIDILKDFSRDDSDYVCRMFMRRHVYEHNGGEADEKYIRDSGDVSVKPKQVLHETEETASRLADLITRIGSNLHSGFHLIFPCEDHAAKLGRKKIG